MGSISKQQLNSRLRLYRNFKIGYTPLNRSKLVDDGDGRLNRTGGMKVKLFGFLLCINLFGVAIVHRIASYITMLVIRSAYRFHSEVRTKPYCKEIQRSYYFHGKSANPYMIIFGLAVIIFSQIPDINQIWWLTIVAAVMSFTYSIIGLGLGIAKLAANGKMKDSSTGVFIGSVSESDKVQKTFQELGDIAFACSYFIILTEIQVIVTTVISTLLPSYNVEMGPFGACAFWPLTVDYPVEMYIACNKIPKRSPKWVWLKILSVACLIISLAAAVGSAFGVVINLESYKSYRTNY